MDESKKPCPLGQVRARCRVKHYSIRTEPAYADWIHRFILFHNKRHGSSGSGGIPQALGYRP